MKILKIESSNYHKFQKGNRIKYTSGRHGDSPTNPLWNGRYGQIYGNIKQVHKNTNYKYSVVWDNNKVNRYEEEDLEY